jgi:hypothetical protein
MDPINLYREIAKIRNVCVNTFLVKMITSLEAARKKPENFSCHKETYVDLAKRLCRLAFRCFIIGLKYIFSLIKKYDVSSFKTTVKELQLELSDLARDWKRFNNKEPYTLSVRAVRKYNIPLDRVRDFSIEDENIICVKEFSVFFYYCYSGFEHVKEKHDEFGRVICNLFHKHYPLMNDDLRKLCLLETSDCLNNLQLVEMLMVIAAQA